MAWRKREDEDVILLKLFVSRPTREMWLDSNMIGQMQLAIKNVLTKLEEAKTTSQESS